VRIVTSRALYAIRRQGLLDRHPATHERPPVRRRFDLLRTRGGCLWDIFETELHGVGMRQVLDAALDPGATA
jgi:hypothetical protein